MLRWTDRARGTDLAIWERIKLVPFTVTIPPEERDTDKRRAELEGLLAWAVRGCLAWQQEGLGTPPEVTRATQAYQAEMDILGHFFADCCRVSADVRVQTGHLYHIWSDAPPRLRNLITAVEGHYRGLQSTCSRHTDWLG